MKTLKTKQKNIISVKQGTREESRKTWILIATQSWEQGIIDNWLEFILKYLYEEAEVEMEGKGG